MSTSASLSADPATLVNQGDWPSLVDEDNDYGVAMTPRSDPGQCSAVRSRTRHTLGLVFDDAA